MTLSEQLVQAAKDGNISDVRRWMEAVDPKEGNSAALCAAARAGQIECVKLLIPVSDPKANYGQPLRMVLTSGLFYADAPYENLIECAKLLAPLSEISSILDHLDSVFSSNALWKNLNLWLAEHAVERLVQQLLDFDPTFAQEYLKSEQQEYSNAKIWDTVAIRLQQAVLLKHVENKEQSAPRKM